MVIRYSESFVLNEEKTSRQKWEEISSLEDLESGREISREEAVQIIKENNLSLVFVSNFGQVYDHPSEPFKKKYLDQL